MIDFFQKLNHIISDEICQINTIITSRITIAKTITKICNYWAVKILSGLQPENTQKSVKSIKSIGMIADNSLVLAIGSPIGLSFIHN
jgi:hypothetical protein